MAVFIQAGWFVVVFSSTDPVETAYRDWIQFHRTAERVVSGNAEEIYPVTFQDDGRPEFSDGFFFLYPPFAAWLTLPLAVLSPLGAYLACALAVAGITLLAVMGLFSGLRADPPARGWAILGTAASAPWNAAVILGHLSATLLVAPALSLLAWARGRHGWSGAALGLLLAKPNWGLPVLILLLAARRWRMVGGFLLAGAALVALSLPLGPGLWGDWLQTMAGYRALVTDTGATQPWRQATLFASLQSLLGRPGSDPAVYGLWFGLSALLFGSVALVWIRAGRRLELFPRLLGTALLAVLVTNPYAYFYDAILLAPAAVVLWTRPASSRGSAVLWGARAVSLGTYVWMHVQFFIAMGDAPSLVGIGLAAWLVLEVADLWALTGHHARPG